MRLLPFIPLFSIIISQFFLDITESSGTEVSRHQSSFFGAGVTIIDYDNDGLDDILVPTLQGQPFKVFKNLGNDTFIDYSESIGFENENSEAINILVADYDNDGFDDIYIVNFSASSALYHNNGDNTFQDVTLSSGIFSNFQTSRAACWLDYDRDGYIDLYMVNRDREEMNILFHNNGDGTFSDVTDIAGVDGTPEKMGLAVVSFDYDNDHWPDIYIGNDFDVGNIFYRNNGDGTFSDYSIETGLDLAFSTMGLAVGDYDGDYDMDIYVTNLDWGNALMRNNDNGTFTNVASELGLEVNLVCWGATFFDYDNDADLDLYVAAGCVSGTALDGELGCSWNGGQSDALSHNNVLFENIGNGNFADASASSGLDNAYLTTGTAIGDINNDGYYDIYEVNELDSNPSSSNICRLYKNNLPQILTDQRHWVKIKLEGTDSNKNAIGSRIYVYPQNAASQMREVMAGESYSSQSSYTISVGLRNRDVIDSVKIIWPSGLVESHHDVIVDQTHQFIEGEGSDTSACLYPVGDYDCEGNCLSELDCTGECNGNAILDCAGECVGYAILDDCTVPVCSGGTTGLVANGSCTDCAEVVNGTAELDDCTIPLCSGGTTGLVANASCTDCVGTVNGEAYTDPNCYTSSPGDICVGGDTGLTPCEQDCALIWGGDSAADLCGVCDNDSSNDNTPTTGTCDCNATPEGTAYVDGCDSCVAGNTELIPCIQDCANVENGIAFFDNCNNCICNGQNLLLGNGCEEIDPCELACDGEWGGDSTEDLCGICDNDVSNDNTANTGTCDCYATPEGTAEVDECGECAGGDTGLTPCVQDCDLIWGGDYTEDLCGICDDDASNDNMPLTGTCDCNATPDGTAAVDECGECDDDVSNDNTTCIGCMHNAACNYDDSALIEGDCEYPLQGSDCDGNPLSIEQSIPTGFGLVQNYPNPFNPSTSINFSIPEFSMVSISIYNVHGQKTKSLLEGKMSPGYHQVSWYGDDENGISAPNGIYFYIMEASGIVEKRKMLLIK